MNNLYLIGFMGCGKSSVARYLERTHGIPRVEMDRDLEDACGKKIAEIFEEEGEEAFRAKETALLQKLAQREGLVISCGGGVALREENVRIMKESGKIVWLCASPETILERVGRTHRRPLVEGKSEEEIRAMIQERQSVYQAAADHIVPVDAGILPAIGEEVKRIYNAGCGTPG